MTVLAATLLVADVAIAQEATKAKPAAAASAANDAASADAAIRATAVAFTEAFNRADAKAVAQLWTADGEYVDDEGQRITGHEAIEKRYAEFFNEHPGAQIKIEISGIHELSADAAIEDGSGSLTLAADSSTTTGRYTAIHVRQDGKWLMASVRDLADNQASAPLKDLEWIIGSWQVEHEGAQVEMNCRWISEGSFIEATHSVWNKGKEVSSGVQIIGRDAASGRWMSWIFDSAGGRAEGVWMPQAGGWAVEFVGVTADGTPTTAVNILSRVEDALVWKSVNRTAGGVVLPDAEEVVLKRK
jgi:uncharacterized protein (TIGR02246 family)